MIGAGGWERLEALAQDELRLAEDDAADPTALAEVQAERAALAATLTPCSGAEHERRLRRLLRCDGRSEAALRRRLAATAVRMADDRRAHSGARAYALSQGPGAARPSSREPGLNSGGQLPIGVSGHPLVGAAPDR